MLRTSHPISKSARSLLAMFAVLAVSCAAPTKGYFGPMKSFGSEQAGYEEEALGFGPFKYRLTARSPEKYGASDIFSRRAGQLCRDRGYATFDLYSDATFSTALGEYGVSPKEITGYVACVYGPLTTSEQLALIAGKHPQTLSSAILERKRAEWPKNAPRTQEPGTSAASPSTTQRTEPLTSPRVSAKSIEGWRSMNSCVRFQYRKAPAIGRPLVAKYRFLTQALATNAYTKIGVIEQVEDDPRENVWGITTDDHVLLWRNECTEPVVVQAWICVIPHIERALNTGRPTDAQLSVWQQGAWFSYGIFGTSAFETLLPDGRVATIKKHFYPHDVIKAVQPGESMLVVERSSRYQNVPRQAEATKAFWLAVDVSTAVSIRTSKHLSLNDSHRLGLTSPTALQDFRHRLCDVGDPSSEFIQMFRR